MHVRTEGTSFTLQRHSGQIQGKQCNQIPARPTQLTQQRNSVLTAHIPSLGAKLRQQRSGGQAAWPCPGISPVSALAVGGIMPVQLARMPRSQNDTFPLSQSHSHPILDLHVLFSLCCCFGLHTDKCPAHPAKSGWFLPFQVLHIPSGMVRTAGTSQNFELSCSIEIKLHFKESSIISSLTLLESCPSLCQTSISTCTLGFLHMMHRKHKY